LGSLGEFIDRLEEVFESLGFVWNLCWWGA